VTSFIAKKALRIVIEGVEVETALLVVEDEEVRVARVVGMEELLELVVLAPTEIETKAGVVVLLVAVDEVLTAEEDEERGEATALPL